MTDAMPVQPVPASAVPELTPVVAPAASAGDLLRAARLAQGVTIEQLAGILKVSERKLHALEDGTLQPGADWVYGRALAASVCRALHLDPTAVLAALPPLPDAAIRADDQSLHTPFQQGGGGLAGWRRQPLLWGVALALAVALAVALWPLEATQTGAEPSAPSNAQSQLLAQPAPTVAPVVAVATPSSTSVPAAASAPTVARVGAAPAVPAVGVSVPATPVAVHAAVAASAQPSAPMAPQAPASALGPTVGVTVRLDGACWVEVRSALGEVLTRRSAQAGESLTVSGVSPLTVVLGRGDLAHVTVRGQALDLSPYLQDNTVARFEVR